MSGIPMIGAIEAGGTKFVCAVGSSPDDVIQTETIETRSPSETLAAASTFLNDAGRNALTSVGIGSFGPLELRVDHPNYGQITSTPKSGWSGTDLVGYFSNSLGVPVALDTDVNAAAIAEHQSGAGHGLDSMVYLTVGTGIGGGVIADGRIVHGNSHPEIGHMYVARQPGDDFDGVCPFHRACLEGLASGPALAARFGSRGEHLSEAGQRAASELAAFYLAACAWNLISTLDTEAIVIGGGVSDMDGFHDAVRRHLTDLSGSYRSRPIDPETFIRPPTHGPRSGITGAMILGSRIASP
jgi:fructokinase